MFIGRERELEALEHMYVKQSFQMAVVYGRRRIGKTALLNEFVKGKESLYLPAEEVNDALNLRKFSRLLGEMMADASWWLSMNILMRRPQTKP
jgi:AAA+ ATPase superfamily predicted ATPase